MNVYFPRADKVLSDADMLEILRVWMNQSGLSERLTAALPESVREKLAAMGGLAEQEPA